ncbi:MAG: flagellar hook-length control protein FliK [Thermodesulfobacteriota bacterium]|nr:flagellar hook-length control protein FliK [Thermodesulfobacteriota bacterium]
MLYTTPTLTGISDGTFTGKLETPATKGEGGAPFLSFLNNSSSPIRNCLGGSVQRGGRTGISEKGSLLSPVPGGKLCRNDLRHILRSLKDTLKETSLCGTGLAIEHPDELMLAEFLRACGLKEAELSQATAKMKGEEGEYNINILFAMLDPQALQDKAQAESLLSPQHRMTLSDLSAISSMLEGFGLTPQEIRGISEKCLTEGGFVKIGQLVRTLEEECKRPLSGMPLEEWHEDSLAGLLAKLGLTEEEIRKIAVEAGLSDKSFSLPKLVSILDKTTEVVERKQNPIDADSFFHNLEHLLSKIKLETEVRPAGDSRMAALRSWQDRWLESLREVRAGLDLKEQALTLDSWSNGKLSVEGGITPVWLEEMAGQWAHSEKLVQKPLFILDGAPLASAVNNVSSAAKDTIRPVVYPEDIFSQITGRLSGSLRLKEDQVIIKLFPPHLGEVKVNLVFKNDQLHTTFTLDNYRVKEIVESGLPQLRTALSEQGIKMGECHVELSQDFRQFFREHEPYAGHDRRPWPLYRDGDEDYAGGEGIETVPINSPKSLIQGIDLFA